MSPRDPRPAPVAWSGLVRMLRRRRLLAAAGAAVVVVAGAGSAVAVAGVGHRQPHHQAPATPRVLAPVDGSLLVGHVQVAQMAGACDQTSCYHVPPTNPQAVRVVSGHNVRLTAGSSAVFTVSAVDLDHPDDQPHLTAGHGALQVAAVPVGRYQVTVDGASNGGEWQFELDVKGNQTRHGR